MAEEPTMIRHLKLLRLLGARQHGITKREMARELEVSEKTIQRDLDVFHELGFPVESDTGDRGKKIWRLGESWRKLPMVFTFEEAAALHLGRRSLDTMAGTPFGDSAETAWRKIRCALGDGPLAYLERFARMFHSAGTDWPDYSSKAAIIEALSIGIEDYKAVHITYQSRNATEPATRDVYPLSWLRNAHALYLLAFAPEHDKIRTYKVDRMEDAEVSNFVFQVHRDFDAAAYLAGSLGIYDGDGDVTVIIRFLPPAARYAEEAVWHDSKEFVPQRDGSLLLRLRLSSTVELKSRILSYGASAIVVEPESLRAEIAAELKTMLAAYGEPDPRARPIRPRSPSITDHPSTT